MIDAQTHETCECCGQFVPHVARILIRPNDLLHLGYAVDFCLPCLDTSVRRIKEAKAAQDARRASK